MNSTSRRLVCIAFALPLAASLAACGGEERERLRADLESSKQEQARLSAAVADVTSQGEAARSKAADLAKDVERLRDEVSAAGAASAEMKTRLDAATAELAKASDAVDTRKKDFEIVEAHRDELKEWIEKELLPIAEEKDPRLANLRDAARDMAAEVSRIRGLPFKQPFMRRLISRE